MFLYIFLIFIFFQKLSICRGYDKYCDVRLVYSDKDVFLSGLSPALLNPEGKPAVGERLRR